MIAFNGTREKRALFKLRQQCTSRARNNFGGGLWYRANCTVLFRMNLRCIGPLQSAVWTVVQVMGVMFPICESTAIIVYCCGISKLDGCGEHLILVLMRF